MDFGIYGGPGTNPRWISRDNCTHTSETVLRIDHILGHKTSLKILKNIEIIQSVFCNYNGMKLEIHSRRKFG